MSTHKLPGQYNPCGAYIPNNSPSTPWGTDMGRYSSNCTPTNHVGVDRGDGFCCDAFGRMRDVALWGNSLSYNIGETIFGSTTNTANHCIGCPMHAWDNHTSSSGKGLPCLTSFCSSPGPPGANEPCRFCGSNLGIPCYNQWEVTWSQCFSPINDLNDSIGCVNPDSYGLITDDVIANSNMGMAGSPTVECTENCMQLPIEYYNDFARYGSSNLPSAVGFGFNNKAIYDCEHTVEDEDVPGPKLIYAGGGWNGTPGASLTYWGSGTPKNFKNFNGLTDSNWRGYLHTTWNSNNAFGRKLSPSSTTNTTTHLWRRKNNFYIDGTHTDSSGADSCCSYVSFGCTDPSFGNYNHNAKLNCDGKLNDNTYTDCTGTTACFKYPNTCDPTDPTLDNLVDTVDDFCYDGGLNCSLCIDSSTGKYIIPRPSVFEHLDGVGQPQCTGQIWDACGGSGYLSDGAWTNMVSNIPTSGLYGPGQIWDKSARREATQWLADEKPICTCANEGCMNPIADNYSDTNKYDCNGLEPGSDPISPMPFGDQTCCFKLAYGCTDPTLPNYFCNIISDGGTIPTNAQWCMDPNTGIPCWDGLVYNSDCGSVMGGIPMNNGNGLYISNLTVQLTDDGQCDIDIILGCTDDGGFDAQGIYPSPAYPGYSALNFNETATVHVQELCQYGIGCIDPAAPNYETLCDGTPFSGVVTSINSLVGDAAPSPPIDAQFVEDNLIPSPFCCDYNLPGSGSGCTDPSALNFNSFATINDGSCLYPVEGCTDPIALNYVQAAMIDDGSCIYSIDFPEEGTNFLDGSEIELCMDPLTKEEVLMNVCQPTEIQSEVFIERGKQSVFEPNQRLGEINTIGGLEIYGYGFYNIKIQI